MRILCKYTMIACILTGLAGVAYAQSAGDDGLSSQVDKAVTALRHEQTIPGTSLAVIRDGKVIKATGYGLANVELNVPVTRHRSFNPDRYGNNSPQPR